MHAGLVWTPDAAAAMHHAGVMSYCSGLLCHLVTRCRANQAVVRDHQQYRNLLDNILPKTLAVDVQLELLEVLFRVYRSAKDMQFDQQSGLRCIQGKLDELVYTKCTKMNLTESLMEIAVAFNAVARPGYLMGPITIFPVTQAYLQHSGSLATISEAFKGVAVTQSSFALMVSSHDSDRIQDDWLMIPISTIRQTSIKAISGKRAQVCSYLLNCVKATMCKLMLYVARRFLLLRRYRLCSIVIFLSKGC